MLSKEEIEKAKEQTKKWIYNMRTGRRVNIIHKGDKDFCDDLEILLQYIDKLEQEIDKGTVPANHLVNKIIDEMVKVWKQDDYRSIEEIKQYFEKKVEGK